MAIALSHGGSTIYSSPQPSEELWVGTTEGIMFLKRDGERSWHVGGQTLKGQHISSILVEPSSRTVFAGAFHGSLHASQDGGSTWEKRDQGLTEQNIYALGCTEHNGRPRLYAGTEPAHLFFSDDLGLHWEELPTLRSVESVSNWTFPAAPHEAHVKQINFDPFDSTTVYVSVEVGGLLKSTDAGQTWVELKGLDEDVHRSLIDPRHSNHLAVATGKGLFLTHDGGETWEQTTSPSSDIGAYPDGFVFCPDEPNLMFVSAAQGSPGSWRKTHSAGARISRSQDGGRTWEILQNGLPDRLQASIEAMCLEQSGSSVSVYAGTTAGEVYCSQDGGDSWSCIVSGLSPVSKSNHYRNLAAA